VRGTGLRDLCLNNKGRIEGREKALFQENSLWRGDINGSRERSAQESRKVIEKQRGLRNLVLERPEEEELE